MRALTIGRHILENLGVIEVALIVLVIAILSFIPCWRIFARAGFAPWLSILIILPLLDLILLYDLGFAEWPAFRKNLERAGKHKRTGGRPSTRAT